MPGRALGKSATRDGRVDLSLYAERKTRISSPRTMRFRRLLIDRFGLVHPTSRFALPRIRTLRDRLLMTEISQYHVNGQKDDGKRKGYRSERTAVWCEPRRKQCETKCRDKTGGRNAEDHPRGSPEPSFLRFVMVAHDGKILTPISVIRPKSKAQVDRSAQPEEEP